MARRATAVSLACLLAAGFVPPLRPAAAQAPGCATTPPPPARALAAHAPAAHASALHGSALHASPAAAMRAPEGRGGRPGPRSPKPQDVAMVMAELGERLSGVTPPSEITVPTRVHVISPGPARRVTDSAVQAQIEALNSAYGGKFGGVDTGVRFRLEGISVKEQPSWFADPVGHERAMKSALHAGGPGTLNLYIAQLSELMLGFASYPYWYAGAPALDGVVIDWRSLPGGAMSDYNKGFTGVHEIGHWLGLFHTFENGCKAPGDGIDDTAPEAAPTEGCPQGKDTCPGDGGRDPAHNYMDYAHDRCMWEFTVGQADRMHEMWAAYRSTPAA
ncbi:zinc metalloprotease [[Actinomadura] parvosata]|uniref:zinc metalloprotease n=1 Tax=[Actinomadura] parvosata TaxID=1955412 RepID=UPI0009AD1D3C|nr:zinc metalloprotease [Nonomuraea sp. ATCC 55076]